MHRCDWHMWQPEGWEFCWRCEELNRIENKKKKYKNKMETLDIKHFKNQLDKGTILPEKLFYMLQEELENGETKMTLIGHDVEDDLPSYQFINFDLNLLMFPIVKK